MVVEKDFWNEKQFVSVVYRRAALPGSRAIFLGTSLLESSETEQR